MKLENSKEKVVLKKRKFILGITVLVVILSCTLYSSLHNNVQLNLKKTNEINKSENIITNKQSVGQYTPWIIKRTDGTKIAYLTFDDGPSVNTKKILNILNLNNIKASFFLIGKNAEQHRNLVRKEFADGEMVGNHTYSHQLSYREDPEIFVNDINKCEKILKSILGPNYKSNFVRFPGGSFGPKLLPFKYAVTKAGYRFVDWNDEIGDADGYNLPVTTLLNTLKKYTFQKTVVILMHDAGAKTTTVKALPKIIQYLKSKGYSFDTLHG